MEANPKKDVTQYKVIQYLTNGKKIIELHFGLPSCTTLQKLVGGYLELYLSAEEEGINDCYCDEEGILKGLPPNPFFPNISGPVVRVKKQ